MERNAGTSCCKLGVRVSGSHGSVAAAAQYHNCLTSVTNTSVLRVLLLYSAISPYFLHYIDERSERCDLFSKDVVTVERALMWQPGPGPWPSWKRGSVVCMQSKQASKHAAAIASYHTKSYCARQAITRSIYRLAADTQRSRISSLTCDIMESFQGRHGCVINPPTSPSADFIMMHIIPAID